MSLGLVLDHVGVGVRELERGRQAFGRLGFLLARRSEHRGALEPGGPVVDFGSANHCAMFRDGYFEVIGPSAPDAQGPVRAMVDAYEGAHIVAIGCSDAEAACAALSTSERPVDEPRWLEREAPYGLTGNETRPVSFRNAFFDRAVFSEARLQYTEHLTPETMWQAELLDQPNGVVGIAEAILCAPEAEALARKLGPMVEAAPEAVGPGEWILGLSRGALRVLSPDAWARLAPGQPTPPLPAPVGIGFRVSSLDRTRACFQANGVSFADGDRLAIGADDACGAVLFFSES